MLKAEYTSVVPNDLARFFKTYERSTVMERKTALRDQILKLIYWLVHWETWHWIIKYIPLVPFWILYCIRARSLWFFTASNPTLTFGGFDGETKMEMYSLLPKGSYPKTILMKPSEPFSDIEDLISCNEFSFPVAVKPDAGRMGLMFRKLSSIDDVRTYHRQMRVPYVLQEYIDFPMEVSVFYYRFPSEKTGIVTGFVKKEWLSVTGDGSSTLLSLLRGYPRVQFRLDEMKKKHAAHLHDIVPSGVTYILSHALNLSRGGQLVSLEHEKDTRLVKVFDDLSHHTGFYFGRYDIKCASVEDLKDAKNFSILEFNGSGAEPHHVYGNGNSLLGAVSILLHHWDLLFKISQENHNIGIPYWRFREGYEHMQKTKKHVALLRALEAESGKPVPSHLKLQPETVPAMLEGCKLS